jgi:hypothetical protein
VSGDETVTSGLRVTIHFDGLYYNVSSFGLGKSKSFASKSRAVKYANRLKLEELYADRVNAALRKEGWQ